MGNPFGSNSPFGSQTNSSRESSSFSYFNSSSWTNSSQVSRSSEDSSSSSFSSAAPSWSPIDSFYEAIREPVLLGDWILYGVYPQSRVNDDRLIDALNQSAVLQPNGWYNLDGSLYAKTRTNSSWDSEEYRFEDGGMIAGGEEYWFICNPIKWKILERSGDECLVVSDYSLDAHIFNEATGYEKNGPYPNNYAKSSLRKWLIEDFFTTAFVFGSDHVLLTDVDNSAATMQESPNPYACENTRDYVFLLSFQDYLNVSYGFMDEDWVFEESGRRSVVTDWARARGAFIDKDGCGYHWTRSASSSSPTDATSVEYGGNLYGNNFIDDPKFSVRPAIRVRLPQNAD